MLFAVKKKILNLSIWIQIRIPNMDPEIHLNMDSIRIRASLNYSNVADSPPFFWSFLALKIPLSKHYKKLTLLAQRFVT